jgi:DNA-binding CsgD family transcriptional regulator
MAGRSKTANLLRASTGGEMRGELSARLPAIKDKVKERLLRKQGRPSTYDPKLGERIFELMAEGYSLTEACDELGLARGTVHGWKRNNEEFATLLADARDALAEFAFSEAYAIPRKLLKLYEDNPDLKLDPARVSLAKLTTDSLRWYSERLAPKTFADKTRKVEISGPNGAPIQLAAVTISAESLSDEQREILRLALSRAKNGEAIDGSFTETPEE